MSNEIFWLTLTTLLTAFMVTPYALYRAIIMEKVLVEAVQPSGQPLIIRI